MPHDLPTNDFLQSTRALWLLLEQGPPAPSEQLQGGPAYAVPPSSNALEANMLAAIIDRALASHDHVRTALMQHSLRCTQDYHLLAMVIGILLSLTTQKSDLLVRGGYGAGKTMCIALLASWFALRGHCVYYASRENTTIKTMAEFVHHLLPRGLEDAKLIALRLFAGSQARSSTDTRLDAFDRGDNHTGYNAKLILATTGLHLAHFRHRFRPLEKAVDYAELFIHDEAQKEASVSDVTILGALPRKCLVLRLGDSKQISGGIAASALARQVREVSNQPGTWYQSTRVTWLPQNLLQLVAQLLIDPMPSLALSSMKAPMDDTNDAARVKIVLRLWLMSCTKQRNRRMHHLASRLIIANLPRRQSSPLQVPCSLTMMVFLCLKPKSSFYHGCLLRTSGGSSPRTSMLVQRRRLHMTGPLCSQSRAGYNQLSTLQWRSADIVMLFSSSHHVLRPVSILRFQLTSTPMPMIFF